MASSSASSRSQAGDGSAGDEYWRRDVDGSSPIPYREAPLQYTLAVMCHCGAKAAQYISWSNLNPGLRYLKCAWAREGGCDFYRFVDPPVTGFLKQLLLDLRDAVKYWKGYALATEHRLEDAARHNQRLQADLEAAEKFNEHRRAMFVEARTLTATYQAELETAAAMRVEFIGRIRTLERDRKFLCAALLLCSGLVAASWMAWSV